MRAYLHARSSQYYVLRNSLGLRIPGGTFYVVCVASALDHKIPAQFCKFISASRQFAGKAEIISKGYRECAKVYSLLGNIVFFLSLVKETFVISLKSSRVILCG